MTLLGGVSFQWDPLPPGIVVAERPSPDSQVVASITTEGSEGRYLFILESAKTHDVLTSREVPLILGYHPPIVRIQWVPDGSRAIATIDHDFGDGVLRMALPRPGVSQRRP